MGGERKGPAVGIASRVAQLYQIKVNALLDRQLDGGIAQSLTVDQLVRWIKAGGSRMRTLTD